MVASLSRRAPLFFQVEEVRNPKLRELPLAVTQKYLVVTCNYLARAAGAGTAGQRHACSCKIENAHTALLRAGVTKLMGIKDAKAKCPALVLVSGEDLTPYRQVRHSGQADTTFELTMSSCRCLGHTLPYVSHPC